MTDAPSTKSQSDAGYERSDVNLKKTIVIAIAVVVVVVISVVVLSEYYLSVREDYVYEMTLKPESAVLRDLRAREDEILFSYRLVDSTQGVYRIPVSRAMERLVEEAYRTGQGR
ncbi:MAG: hypothetical protein JSW34_08925 [Candidatus Zixiibacteriota bacterium]|nr:MAG: hypothetical protein JSW34_08925 [candidate division Zixibacteria bacterium]